MTDPAAEIFAGTAPYYARHRPGYPPAFFALLADRFGLDGTQTALDLGTGTGQIALPMARLVRLVIAVDPSAEMLAEARRAAVADDRDRSIDFRLGDSSRLAQLDLPSLDLVTMGSSFHWMDRAEVVRELDRMVAPGGGLVLASTHGVGTAPWEARVAEVRTRFLGPERRAGSGTYTHSAERHEDVLRRSPFSELTTSTLPWSLPRSVDDLVGLQLSYSYSSPGQLGARRADFERAVRDTLEELVPPPGTTEPLATEVIVATRPGLR